MQTSSKLSEPLHSLSNQQRAWSACGSTHSNLSEPLHSLRKQQLAWSAHGSTPSNISEPLHSLSKQQRERSDRGSTPSPSTSLQGIEGVQGARGTGSGRFKHREPHRTLANCILTELERYREIFYTSSGWFDCTEPSLTTALQGLEGVQGERCTSSKRFKHIEPHRTFSNYILTELARCIAFFHMSSGWFDCTEPSQTTSLQGIQGVQGAIGTEVKAQRTTSSSS